MALTRRQFVGGLLGLPLTGLSGSGGAQEVALNSIRINVPGSGAMPFMPVELIGKIVPKATAVQSNQSFLVIDGEKPRSKSDALLKAVNLQ